MIVVIIVYVDDILLTSGNEDLIAKLKIEMDRLY